MRRIGLIIDTEAGHTIPFVDLGLQLMEHGHEVVFIGLAQSIQLLPPSLRSAYVSVLDGVYEAATIRAIRQQAPLDFPCYWGFDAHLERLLDPGLRDQLRQLRLDALIANPFLGLETAIAAELVGAPAIFALPMMGSEPGPLAKMHLELQPAALQRRIIELLQLTPDDLEAALARWPALILCAREFELPELVYTDAHAHYVGPCLRDYDAAKQLAERGETETVYVSLGSTRVRETAPARALLHALLDEARANPSTRFLVTGAPPGEVPPNVELRQWFAQRELMRSARATVIHGGLGGIRDAIAGRLAPIVTPFVRDQPDNARRVAYHGLGLDLRGQVEQLGSALRRVRAGEFDERVEALRERFRELDRARTAARTLDQLLA
ncbi:UDP-glucose:sterol glucosyltransferase [Enhygromyxa salina]|uniref:UDP-glucose:sterol glucosyltransferase n=1 Tax=Enhygromyxa salina TaxID=215803 RepID=A0A0C2DCJ1_9BACT|nr:glycosyltransferase [Enhygromyxa salina]KIG19150.1 UDP-glucose:sterol glucosyltransferase [Enhygromyxa salina]